jgi:hypothetical protein
MLKAVAHASICRAASIEDDLLGVDVGSVDSGMDVVHHEVH